MTSSGPSSRFRKSPLTTIPPEIVAVSDYEALARARLDDNAWAYLSGGAADEITLRANRDAFDRLSLVTRVLGDFSGVSGTRRMLFGQTLDYPILLAPVAYHKLAHDDGELATALGAAAARAGFIVSTHSSVSFEEIASATQTPLWFQLYFKTDRNFTRELVQRAAVAGYGALVVTVDAPVNTMRNREQRAQFHLPPGVDAANLRGLPPAAAHEMDGNALCGGMMATAPTWKDIEWLQSITKLPVIIKGIMSPEDALLAAQHGAAGLVVSNHGGRTLDTACAAIHALPRIADVIEGRLPLLLDGGIRRGTDILKALALGASAVLIGRPYIYGLAAAGAVGVAHVLNILRAELEVAMALTGCPTLDKISRNVIWHD
ncbi:MAG TPA: alpha-hydroxy acid oxidase [Lacunisphaera sp.]|jgi:4-hydroxymandelate oxidase